MAEPEDDQPQAVSHPPREDDIHSPVVTRTGGASAVPLTGRVAMP